MKKEMTLSELRTLVRAVIEEDMGDFRPRSVPPPLPARARQVPASAALPAKGALHKFKADVNMAFDAMGRAKQAMDAADTKETLRWLAKVMAFATSAQRQLKQ